MVDADAELRAGMAADIEEMDRIIGQFLDFARAEGGEPSEPTDLATLAREVGKHYRDVGHSLAEEIEAVPEVPVRRLAVRRVIANLLDNAFRYGETDVRLCVRAADRGVAIEVLDRGPGIPPAEVERLKQPFTRLDNSRTGKSGSGLGLAIVDRIAKLHGAQFDLLPREGGGLVARLTFPRAG
jgi:two-component system osmolarity sensor histidine kinase EnvZ